MTKTLTKESSSLDVRNALIPIFQNLPEGPECSAVEEAFERLTDYIQLQSGGVPGNGATSHEEHIAQLKTAIGFFMTMSQCLSNLGLISNWKLSVSEMGKGVWERVLEDRAKYRRMVKLIAEIYTVHLGGNGAMFSLEALPDDIRIEVTDELKRRKLLHD